MECDDIRFDSLFAIVMLLLSLRLWVPQGTTAQTESDLYQGYFGGNSRINSLIIEPSSDDNDNVLTKDLLLDAMKMHQEIASGQSQEDGETYTFTDLCVSSGGTCANTTAQPSASNAICNCLVTSILKQWNYNVELLEQDDNILSTLNGYGTQQDLEAVLGQPTFDDDGQLVSAEAFILSYFLEDRSYVEDGTEIDPINEGWEKDVFLAVAEDVGTDYPSLYAPYFSARSFQDEFGGAINSDILLVQVSFALCFVYVAATIGKFQWWKSGSRWTLALAALITCGLAVAGGLGLASAFGLFFGPVHNFLPFIMLGIGVDDAFVIVNAFDRERKVKRSEEDDEGIAQRAKRALGRAGSSITVTSMTDFVVFAISSSSGLPALASFSAYAAICIFLLWLFAALFFSSTFVLDERRQRDNRRECLCCTQRKAELDDPEEGFEEGIVSKYFRKYHAPALLSLPGKLITVTVFAGLLGFGVFGMINLSVEDTSREFFPSGSYVFDFFDAVDEYFPSTGIDYEITFEEGSNIYKEREALSELNTRLTGLENNPPYIAEPVSESTYRNLMTGLHDYLVENGSGAIGNVTLDSDSWPTNEDDFYLTVKQYTSSEQGGDAPGAEYKQDVSFGDDNVLNAYKMRGRYVSLTKKDRDGKIIDDADRQIDAMDATRDMVNSWTELQPAFPYSEQYLTIEGFKVIQEELYRNVALAIGAVAVIVFFTVASPMTTLLITANIAFCLIEILGFMWLMGFAIDSVTVILLALAVGLSVDYSAHVGHTFMVKKSIDKNKRAAEALSDMGAAVLSGGISTFLAVIVLLFSDSYVFIVLSRQFCLTVLLGLGHGLFLLPVMLSWIGPKAFSAGQDLDAEEETTGKDNGKTLEDSEEGDDKEVTKVDATADESEAVMKDEPSEKA
mmetsp:Transcript_3720/g.9341  ORF Transcript_3720/g.9341 Transcript_3720/m.9341 type:complete len:904 (+) Transcript_3720:610-3321(+)